MFGAPVVGGGWQFRGVARRTAPVRSRKWAWKRKWKKWKRRSFLTYEGFRNVKRDVLPSAVSNRVSQSPVARVIDHVSERQRKQRRWA